MTAWYHTRVQFYLAHGPWSESSGRWFPPEPKYVFTSGWTPFRCEAGREIIPGSFAVSRGAVTFIHIQTADYTVHFIAVATPATPFTSLSSPVHSLSARTYARSLTLARPLTPCTPYTHTQHALPCYWKGPRHSVVHCKQRSDIILHKSLD